MQKVLQLRMFVEFLLAVFSVFGFVLFCSAALEVVRLYSFNGALFVSYNRPQEVRLAFVFAIAAFAASPFGLIFFLREWFCKSGLRVVMGLFYALAFLYFSGFMFILYLYFSKRECGSVP